MIQAVNKEAEIMLQCFHRGFAFQPRTQKSHGTHTRKYTCHCYCKMVLSQHTDMLPLGYSRYSKPIQR